ncbi:LOG family protein [Candidatus Gottesmanbacteria bacterium]|nr:LOG family protein [Candidatus Gottesmanbacteria bacterium]
MQKKIVVFAGNECKKEKETYYYLLAYTTGKLLAEAGFIAVTGGGPGLMNEVSRGAIEAGGETIGVCLNVPGRKHSAFLTKRIMFEKLTPRLEKLISLADGFLALPGGIGTLHEIAVVLALKRKNEIAWDKPLIIIDKYYQEFNIHLEKMKNEGFVDDYLDSLYIIAGSAKDALERLKLFL